MGTRQNKRIGQVARLRKGRRSVMVATNAYQERDRAALERARIDDAELVLAPTDVGRAEGVGNQARLDVGRLLLVAGERIAIAFPENGGKAFMAEFVE